MAQLQNNLRCEHNNVINKEIEQKKEEIRKIADCNPPPNPSPNPPPKPPPTPVVEECPKKFTDCCTLPPVTPIPLIEIDSCKKPKCPNEIPCCKTVIDPGCKNTKCPKDVLCTAVMCPCKKTICPNLTFCTTVNNECENFDLTPYGKEFAANTGKMIKHCLCVKFNGLQDSCKHPNCYTRIGCFDIPFPTCPPARKWKNDFICKYQKRPKEC